MFTFSLIVGVGDGLPLDDDGDGLPLDDDGDGLPLDDDGDGLLLVGVGDEVGAWQPLFQTACPVEFQFSPGNGGLSRGGMMSLA